MKRLVIAVKEIIGKCPVYKIGDKIILDEGYKVNLKETNAMCFHSLSSIIPYYNAIFRGIKPKELGLSKDKNAYVQCLDPCKYTGGGTVIFEIFCETIIDVECYSGFRYGERPIKIKIDDDEFKIKEILNEYREPEKINFEVLLEDGRKIRITYSEKDKYWRMD